MDYTIIARKFVDQFFPDAQGALLSGSAVTGEMAPNSDLDILIFYEDIHTHYRKLYCYNGQKVEAMVHKIRECRETFEADSKRRNKAFLDLIVKGVIIKDTNQAVASLQSEARNIYDQGPPPFTPYETALYHYIISNRLDDFKDNENYHEGYFILSNLLYFLTKVMLISHGQWTNKGEGKWQLRAIQAYDQDAGQQLTDALDDFFQNRQKGKIIALTQKTLDQLGRKETSAYEAGIPPEFNKVRKWFLIDLYYAEPQEAVLSELIKPAFRNLQEKAGVEQLFFTRNYKNGAHISLYLATDSTTFEEHILPYTEDTINSYLSMNPSLRFMPDTYKRLPKKFQLYPNNSVQYHEFEVDLMKYIGSEGLKIFEQQFKASSEFVLDLIGKEPETNYNNKLGEVIKINWTMLQVLGLNLEEISLFFRTYWNSWGIYQFSTIPGPFIFNDKVNHSPVLTQEQEVALHQNFEDKYQQQKEQMLSYLRYLWEMPDHQEAPEKDVLMQSYLEALRIIRQTLLELHQQQCLFMPDPIYDQVHNIRVLEQYPLWFFYKEFIHATNNRLGLLYENERYITYLMQNCAYQLSLGIQEEKAMV